MSNEKKVMKKGSISVEVKINILNSEMTEYFQVTQVKGSTVIGI